MGQVYLVENPALRRREAMKVISTRSGTPPGFTERFAREARTAAGLQHPSIIDVHAYGVDGDSPWFTMNHLDGVDLSQAQLSVPEVFQVAEQVAAALDYAHRRGVIHRDIKPANIFLTRDDDGHLESVTVLDFGIARLADATGLTNTGMLVGTVSYTAPEVIDGQPPTPAVDQYALACTAYRLLTGRPPFTGDNPVAVMRAHSDTQAPSLSVFRPELASLDPVFARALAKKPSDRFATCREFAAALAAGSGHSAPTTVLPHDGGTAVLPPGGHRFPVGAPPPPPPHHRETVGPPAAPSPARTRKRRGLVVGVLAVVVVLVAGGVAGFLLLRGSAPPPAPTLPDVTALTNADGTPA